MCSFTTHNLLIRSLNCSGEFSIKANNQNLVQVSCIFLVLLTRKMGAQVVQSQTPLLHLKHEKLFYVEGYLFGVPPHPASQQQQLLTSSEQLLTSVCNDLPVSADTGCVVLSQGLTVHCLIGIPQLSSDGW